MFADLQLVPSSCHQVRPPSSPLCHRRLRLLPANDKTLCLQVWQGSIQQHTHPSLLLTRPFAFRSDRAVCNKPFTAIDKTLCLQVWQGSMQQTLHCYWQDPLPSGLTGQYATPHPLLLLRRPFAFRSDRAICNTPPFTAVDKTLCLQVGQGSMQHPTLYCCWQDPLPSGWTGQYATPHPLLLLTRPFAFRSDRAVCNIPPFTAVDKTLCLQVGQGSMQHPTLHCYWQEQGSIQQHPPPSGLTEKHRATHSPLTAITFSFPQRHYTVSPPLPCTTHQNCSATFFFSSWTCIIFFNFKIRMTSLNNTPFLLHTMGMTLTLAHRAHGLE